MIGPVQDDTGSPQSPASRADDDSTFAELRDRVAQIAQEVAAVAAKPTRVTREYSEAGTAALRRTIRRQPVVSMAVAVGVGALFALAFVPRFTRPTNLRWSSWIPSMPVTRADLYDMADSIQHSLSRAAYAVPTAVTPAFERLLDAFTRTDPSAALGSILEKASGWLTKTQDKIKGNTG
jgi:hypothetical protein